MFESICASKLYRASSRKDKIEAAFNNPINSELVGQLATALDEEFKRPEYLVKESDTPKDTPKDSAVSTEPSESEPSVSTVPGGGGHASASPDLGGEPEKTSESETPEGGEEEGDSAEPTEPESKPVEESTSVDSTPVVGSLMRNPFKNMRQVAEQIKGMLNFKASTHGVNRILCKENELWIYYNDDVNLNSVMAEVIETLNAASYVYLEFNRLARSDNAIVFLIDFSDSNNLMLADPVEQKK